MCISLHVQNFVIVSYKMTEMDCVTSSLFGKRTEILNNEAHFQPGSVADEPSETKILDYFGVDVKVEEGKNV